MTTRHQKILDLLRQRGEATVSELAEVFGVAPMTIRRDLELLARQQQVTRTHGGAMAASRAVAEFAFLERARERLAEKAAIARAAAALIEPGMTLVLDTGTTTLEVARALASVPDVRVLTSSLAIAAALYACANIDLVLLGGRVRRHSPDLIGPVTEDNLRRFRVQLAILGADALDRDGIYTDDLGVAGVSRAMIAGAEDVVLVADSSKFTRRAFAQFADWTQVRRLITDAGASADDRRWLAEADIDACYV